MALIERFEDIRAWQEARKLTQHIYGVSDGGNFARDFGLRDQIRRAAVSMMANIAEGFDCDSQKEFARFLEIARRSAVEVQSLLYVALDANYLNQDAFGKAYRQTAHVKSLIHALRRSVLRRAPKP